MNEKPVNEKPVNEAAVTTTGDRNRAIPTRAFLQFLGAAVVMTVVALGCAQDTNGGPSDGAKKEVRLLTYDSFALPESAAAEFKKQTGADIRIIESGDAAEMLTKALLTSGAPEGDVIFGIDNTLATRALGSELLDQIDSTIGEKAEDRFKLSGSAAEQLVPVDHGDVCMNVDSSFFAEKNLAVPDSLDDLVQPAYRGMTVVPSPVTSSPGLAFLIGTVAKFGNDGWESYWKALKANDVAVRPSWNDAYYTDYTVSGGDRPIVLSYASSPPAEVVYSEGKRDEPVSKVMDASCVAQVEYAGILKGTKNAELAEKLLRFMLSDAWQKELPLSNFVYPVIVTQLPEEFNKWAPAVSDPLSLPADQIDSNRDKWIEQWRQIME